MEKNRKQKVANLFKRNIEKDFPQFQLSKIKSKYLFGEPVFRWIVNDKIHVFFIVVPNEKKDDEFTLEIGWSKLSRFPELL
jgi:hypothetical protein